MQIANVTAWIPVVSNRIGYDGRFFDDTAALGAFLEELPSALHSMNPGISQASTAVHAECPEALRESIGNKVHPALLSFVCVAADVTVDAEQLHMQNPGREFDSAFIASVATIFLSETIEKALVLSELAYPGCVGTLDGLVFVEQRI